MCGISGIYASEITHRHKEIIHDIVQQQKTRGPDHQEIVYLKGENCQLLLGHNRLSVIDLTDAANQPMWDISKRYCIIFNGEIYNYLELREELIAAGYSFNTKSDTEVILNAVAFWGMAALEKFRGPFAFALYDKEQEILYLCRDRFGVRPLFYLEINNTLYFASTVTTIAKHLQLKPNLFYVAQGLEYLIYEDGSHQSPYEKIHSLPAGYYLSLHLSIEKKITSRLTKYYDLNNSVYGLIAQFSHMNHETLLATVAHELEQSVNIRLRADVPLAISLSSGLDSTSVAALVSRQHDRVLGFTFAEAKNHKTEGPLVEHCANYLNMQIEYVWPTPDEMNEAVFKTIAAQEAPFASLSVVAQYFLYSKVRSSGIKVLLGGQGGDEVFMGYKKFMLLQLKQLMQNKSYSQAFKNLLHLLPMIFAEIPALSNYLKHLHRYTNHSLKHHTKLCLPENQTLVLNNIKQPLWQRQSQDILQFSLPTLLRYEDRNAMGNSVESRLPYMDHKLVELGLALPISLKLHGGFGKWAIRNIMQNKLPNEIRLARNKRGFDIPIKALLKAGLGAMIRSTLKSNQSVLKHFFKEINRIDEIYSDSNIEQKPKNMTELLTLLWLNKVYS